MKFIYSLCVWWLGISVAFITHNAILMWADSKNFYNRNTLYKSRLYIAGLSAAIALGCMSILGWLIARFG